MNVRSAVVAVITADPELAALGLPAGHVFQQHTVEVEALPDAPFVVLRWQPTQQGVHRLALTRQYLLDVVVNDERGEYDRINAMLDRMSAPGGTFDSLVGATVQGTSFSGAEWLEDSADFDDEVFSTFYRVGSYRLTARPA